MSKTHVHTLKKISKTHVHTLKRWVKLMFILYDDLTKKSLENLSNCSKVWTWVLHIF